MSAIEKSGYSPDLLREIESVINQISGVISSKLVAKNDSLVEIHVLYEGKRAPKFVSQDIQALLAARWEISIDKNIISIAQVGKPEKQPQPPRLQISGVSTRSRGSVSEVSVELSLNGTVKRGTAAGPETVSNKMRISANACLNSLGQYLPADYQLVLEATSIERVSHSDVVVTCVTIVHSNHQETLLGTCVVEWDLVSSTVKATLDSLNRRFGILAAV